jgi:hypothetical protein
VRSSSWHPPQQKAPPVETFSIVWKEEAAKQTQDRTVKKNIKKKNS